MIPDWARQVGLNAKQLQEIADNRLPFLLWHLSFYAEHTCSFDVTFLTRQPILEVQLDQDFARQFRIAHKNKDAKCLAALLNAVRFSDGTTVNAAEIWTFNYMPDDLSISGIDLVQGEQIVGLNGETTREIIRQTYHCQSRAEEDFFLARWIAS